ncbi:hypothetical protein GALL_201250 [mine drainage metagenome]|uniref:Uncharacterized protein n=1 Tax=mine drainage metagenome TaxID=410659 RepID=A0A1J5RNI8_9ZZZZ
MSDACSFTRALLAIALGAALSISLSACGGGGGADGSGGLSVAAQSTSTVAGNSVVVNGYAQTAGQAISSASWQQIAGPTAQVSDANCSSATQNTISAAGTASAASSQSAALVNYVCPLTVTLPNSSAAQQYQFRFTANDATGNQQSALSTVSAIATPGAAFSTLAGPNANLYPRQTYKGACQTVGGVFAPGQSPVYQWSITAPSGVTPPAIAASGASVSFVAPSWASQENLQLVCQATDGMGTTAQSAADVAVYGTASLPLLVVSAGSSQVVNTATPVTMTATAQASGGVPSSTVYYLWQQTGGTSVTLANANTATASFVAPGQPTVGTPSASGPSIQSTLTFTVYASYQPITAANLSSVPAAQQSQTTVEVIQQ